MSSRVKILEMLYRVCEPSLILEAMALDAVHDKYYPNIPEYDFNMIVSSDPTSKQNKIGKYSKWLLNLYELGELDLDSLEMVNWCLSKFHEYKNSDYIVKKDITTYGSIDELMDVISDIATDAPTSKSDEIRKTKKTDAEKVYEDDTWLVIVPKTPQAAVLYGKNTKWCTSAINSNRFYEYSGKPLYININKRNKHKFQFYVNGERAEFKDAENIELPRPTPEIIEMTEGLLNFYKEVSPEVFINLYFKTVYEKSDGIYRVWNGKGYNFVTPKLKLLRDDMWFEDAYDFHEGLAAVTININDNYMYYIDKRGNFLKTDFNLEDAYDFNEGWGYVWVEGKGGNFINKRGELLRKDLWFVSCTGEKFENGVAYVETRKYGRIQIDTEGNLLFDTYKQAPNGEVYEDKTY